MAAESKTMRTILETSEDWETWYDELKTISANEFWNMADPDQPTVLPAAAPYKPVVADIVQGETLYTNLSAANQRMFDNARKHYESDQEDYIRQETSLTTIRKHIVETVPITNRTSLKASMSVKECLIILRNLMAPPTGHSMALAKEKYDKLLRMKAKPLDWLDKWEKVVAKARQHDLSEFKHGIWLGNMSSWMKPHAPELSYALRSRGNDAARNDISQYPEVLREIREYLRDGVKQTVRGAAFQTLVDDEDEDGLLEEVANTATKRKRANTTGQSHRGGKRHDKICPACERPGHDLENCWFIFPEGKPDDCTLGKRKTKEVNNRVDKDRKLKKRSPKDKEG